MWAIRVMGVHLLLLFPIRAAAQAPWPTWAEQHNSEGHAHRQLSLLGQTCSATSLCNPGLDCVCGSSSNKRRRTLSKKSNGRRLFGAPAATCTCNTAPSPSPAPPSPSPPSPPPPAPCGVYQEIRDGSSSTKANYYYADTCNTALMGATHTQVVFRYALGACPSAVTSSSQTFGGSTCPLGHAGHPSSSCLHTESGRQYFHSSDWSRGNPSYCVGIFLDGVKLYTWTAA